MECCLPLPHKPIMVPYLRFFFSFSAPGIFRPLTSIRLRLLRALHVLLLLACCAASVTTTTTIITTTIITHDGPCLAIRAGVGAGG